MTKQEAILEIKELIEDLFAMGYKYHRKLKRINELKEVFKDET